MASPANHGLDRSAKTDVLTRYFVLFLVLTTFLSVYVLCSLLVGSPLSSMFVQPPDGDPDHRHEVDQHNGSRVVHCMGGFKQEDEKSFDSEESKDCPSFMSRLRLSLRRGIRHTDESHATPAKAGG